jgi:hypothetical protein
MRRQGGWPVPASPCRSRRDREGRRMNGNARARAALVAAAALSAIVLQGCREEEQGRILYFEKGEYLGKADSELPEQTVEVLRQRANQAF